MISKTLSAGRAIATAMVLSGAIAGAATAECDPGEVTLKFSLVTKLDGHPKGEAALAWAELVNTQMQGRACMELYPSSQLYDDTAVFPALLANEVQIAAPSASKFSGITGLLSIFDVPFLFDSALHVNAFLETPEARGMFQSLEAEGYTVLGFWSNGMYQMSATRVLRKPEDASGLVFRVQSASKPVASMLEKLGVTGQTLPFSKVLGALQSGEVQGQYNTWSNILTEGFYLEQAAIVETNHGYLGYPVVMSRDFYRSLDPALRRELVDLFELVTHERNRFAFEINEQSRLDILYDDGVVVRLTDEELSQWRAAFAPILDEFRSSVDTDLIDAAVEANAAADPFALD